jgi:hyperosmotically inducible protein
MQAMADLALGSRVAAVLTRDARTAGADLKVEAHHGVVTVTGIVGSQRVVDSILTVASAVEGVEQVKSEVSIGRVHE